MSKFWEHARSVRDQAVAGVPGAVDDVRHKLVEEGWFSRTDGRTVTGNIEPYERPEAGKKPAETPLDLKEVPQPGVTDAEWSEIRTDVSPFRHRHHDLYESVWGHEPQGAELYGQNSIEQKAPEPGIEPEI